MNTFCPWARKLRLLFFLSCGGALFWVKAVSLREPAIEVYAARGGGFIIRVEPGEYGKNDESLRRASARVFAFNKRNKTYRDVAFFSLENELLPGKLLITEDGTRIVGVDDWGNWEKKYPVLVVYDQKGKVLKRFYLQDLLSPAEIEAIKPPPSEFLWEPWAEHVWIADESYAVCVNRNQTKSDDDFHIDLKTFEIKRKKL